MAASVYNNTRHDQALLRDVMTYAARRMGVRGGVIVKVTTATSHRSSGTMWRGFPYAGYLRL